MHHLHYTKNTSICLTASRSLSVVWDPSLTMLCLFKPISKSRLKGRGRRSKPRSFAATLRVGMACWVWGPGTHEGLQLELEHNWRVGIWHDGQVSAKPVIIWFISKVQGGKSLIAPAIAA
ncbi:MAG: hypothetical protein FRX49_10523 [Trebouxia sp. A1-2]|nr:MAG: hypothetical protein FRX49_10523 [Trebouxia sp. A1-2]